MWQPGAESPYDLDLKAKGDEIQKLSVIESLPQRLAEDAYTCITRVLPKIQQTLPTASTEFHMATAVIFKQVLEQRLVSHATFTEVFLKSILSSLGSREPVVSHAWLETVLDVIELLPVDVIKREILPIAKNEGQLSQPVNSRIMCCRLMGKIATRFDAKAVKDEIIPTVLLLCQDINSDVRACICLQLHLVVQNSGDNISKILPSVLELANDEESNVRQAAVQTIGLLLPHLKPDTIGDVIVPLIKVTSENAVKSEDNVICVVAQEFGKLAQSTEAFLMPADKSWFIKYFIQLAQTGTHATKDELKHDLNIYTGSSIPMSDRCAECRRNCAYNMPAMLLFASNTSEGAAVLIPTFHNLANDSYYLVRRTIACSVHEVIKVLGAKSDLIKNDLIKLMNDDNEEVLQGLIPQISEIIESLLHNRLLGMDPMEPSTVDLGRSLIKCEAEISMTNNWRLSAVMLNQFEILPKCFSSDFIYTYIVPVVTNRVLYSRPLPVRLAGGRTLLIFLRYNLKSQQKAEMRSKICNDFACSSSSYLRMIFIRMMIEALSIFSSMYFKEHFCATLLNRMDDPVPNVRLKAISLAPTIKSCLRLPADKKLLSTLETNIRTLKNNEKDRDVLAALTAAVRQMDSMEVRVDGQPSPSKHSKYDSEDIKKYEEEKKLEAATVGGVGTRGNVANFSKKPTVLKIPPSSGPARPQSAKVNSPVKSVSSKTAGSTESPKAPIPPKPPLMRQTSLSSAQVSEGPKASTSNDTVTSTNWSRFSSINTQLTQPWEKVASTTCHNAKLTSTNPSYSANEYSAQKVQCSCYDLSDRIFHTPSFSSNPPDQSYRSDPSRCACLSGSNYIKTTNLFHTKHEHRFSDFGKQQQQQQPALLTSMSSIRDDKHDIWQDLMLSRSSTANKYRGSPGFANFQSQYKPYWAFSSMPEIPVTLIDDEFMVDAGIRIPSQLASSQSSSKIPNLQDIIYRKKKLNINERERRFVPGFDHSKSFAFSMHKSFSLDYDDTNSSSNLPINPSVGLSQNNRDAQYSHNSQPSDEHSKSSSLASQNRVHYGYDLSHQQHHQQSHQQQQRKVLDDKDKQRSPMYMDKERSKALQPKNVIDRSKRHTLNYGLRVLPDSKESKLKFKRHNSVEAPEYGPSERNGAAGRALRRLSNLDVNHNQGLSKIPVRSGHVSGSRTAPVTRTSSPIGRLEAAGLFDKSAFKPADGFAHDRRLRRFRSSDEEVDKLCQKF